jgi:hypothetical protein
MQSQAVYALMIEIRINLIHFSQFYNIEHPYLTNLKPNRKNLTQFRIPLVDLSKHL